MIYNVVLVSGVQQSDSDVSDTYIHIYVYIYMGSQVALVVKNTLAEAGDVRCEFDPCIRNQGQPGVAIPWRRARQPTLVFLPGESHRQRCLAGYIVHRVTESPT